MNILITGTDGLLGFNICKYLSEHTDYKIFSTSRKNRNNILENHILCDLASEQLEIKGIDAIVHCAATFPASFSSQDNNYCAKMNRKIDDNIIELSKINNSKVIFISSVSVYKNFSETVKEDSELCDNNEYALEKINTEKLLLENNEHFILRVPSPYGLKQQNKNVLKIFVDKIKCDEDITYFGQGLRQQNFINVLDISRAVKICIESDKTGIYNIASDKNVNMKELAHIICTAGKSILNSTSKAISIEGIDEYNHLNIDISKAIDTIGFKPIVSIEDGICEILKEET